MKKYKYIILLLVLAPIAAIGKDKEPTVLRDTADPFMELMIIEDYYKSMGDSAMTAGDYIAWMFDYTQYEIGARDPNSSSGETIDTAIEGSSAIVRVWGNKVVYQFDSSVMIQDSQYCLTVDFRSEVMNITSPVPVYRHLMNVDLLDSILYSGQVKDIITYDSIDTQDGDSLKTIVWRFNNESPYIRYAITYRVVDHMIEQIEYWIRMEIVPPNTAWHIPANYRRITWKMYNIDYVPDYPNPDEFSIYNYLELRNGILVPGESYADEYTLINSIDQ
jgi:hypothetical protein